MSVSTPLSEWPRNLWAGERMDGCVRYRHAVEIGNADLVVSFPVRRDCCPRTEFWAPVAPPRTHYTADVKYDPAISRLEGTERISFRNDVGRSIGRVALQWFGDSLTVRVDGTSLQRVPGSQSVALFDLPRDLVPGAEIVLAVAFGASWKLDPKTESAITSSVVPKLWWGFGTLDDYEVRSRRRTAILGDERTLSSGQ